MKLSLFKGILLGAFIFSAVVGVIVFATFQGGSSSATQIGTVVIWGALPKDEIDAALTFARQTNDDLKGVSYIQKEIATLRNDLINALAEGSAPDMVLISHEDLLSLAKVLAIIPATTLSERTFKDAFAAGGEVYLAPDGSGTLGVPFLIDSIVLYSNRTMLASSGIAAPPATWEALTGLVPRFTEKTTTGNISRGLIALGTYGNVVNARGILSTLFMQAGMKITSVGQNGLRRADLGTSQANGTSQGQGVIRYYTQFADPTKVSYTWNSSLSDSQARFVNGYSALYLGYASEASYIAEANPNLDFDVSIVPQLGTSATKTTYGLMYAFAIPRGSANSDGAFKAAAALTAPAVNQAAANATHMAPADRVLLAAPPSESRAAVTYASALYARGWLSPSPIDTDSIFSTMITNVITGRLTIDAALTSAESALSARLQQ